MASKVFMAEISDLVLFQEDDDADTESLLAADFEIGHFIRERIVPRAVLYFTGEALVDDEEVCTFYRLL